jgi:hypothetical protein
MAKRNRPADAPGESEAVETGLQRIQRQVQERAQREREARQKEYDAAWADLRAAVARGEITRQELLGDHTAEPIRVSIGDSNFEISIAATVREVPAAQPARPAADVLAFPASGGIQTPPRGRAEKRK